MYQISFCRICPLSCGTSTQSIRTGLNWNCSDQTSWRNETSLAQSNFGSNASNSTTSCRLNDSSNSRSKSTDCTTPGARLR